MNIIFKNDPDLIYPYTFDSSNLKGYADNLFIPENIDELREGVSYLYQNDIKFTVSGAGTGITGGRVPFGGTVISMEKFKNIDLIDEDSVSVGAAVTLNELDIFLKQFGLYLPTNPTETNASLGGNTSTNASGARTFKYGPIRNYVTGIKAVLANGDILALKRGENYADNFNLSITSETGKVYNIKIPEYSMPAVKNASGYFANRSMDAIDLFIGSEGTLCIFTEIELKILKRSENILGGIVFFDNSEKLLEFVTILRELSLRNNLIPVNENNEKSARLIEYFDVQSLHLLRNKYSEIPEEAVGAIWFEQEYASKFEEKLLSDWYEFINNYTGLTDNTWFAMNDNEHEKLKNFRHELPLQVYENLTNNSQKKVGLDTAVPDSAFYNLFNFYLENFKLLNLDYVVFGHIGNCHLHANIFCKNDDEYAKAMEFYDKSIDLSLSLGGTISAEHGIGKLKKHYLIKMYGDNAVREMQNVKLVLDNKQLLNSGTLFDL